MVLLDDLYSLQSTEVVVSSWSTSRSSLTGINATCAAQVALNAMTLAVSPVESIIRGFV